MSISLSEIQARLGGSNPISFSEYYKNGLLVDDGFSFSNYTVSLSGTHPGSVPSSGAVSLAQINSANKSKLWSISTSPLKTAWSTNNTTGWLDIRQFLKVYETGKQFYISTDLNDATWWTVTRRFTKLFTVGTPLTVTTPYAASKQYYTRIYYDGGYNIKIQGYYSGSSTDGPYGQVFLQGIGEIG